MNPKEQNEKPAAAVDLSASEEAKVGGGEGKKKKEKKTPANIVIPPKKPKLSKAERRALQEAQRAAKGQKKDGGGGEKQQKQAGVNNPVGGSIKADAMNEVSSKTGNISNHHNKNIDGTSKRENDDKDKTLNFFSHLPSYKGINHSKDKSKSSHQLNNLHPKIISLGIQYQTGEIRGANARAKAMLYTFQKVIQDYDPLPSSQSSSPSKTKDIRFSIEHDLLKPAFNYLSNKCRTHSVTMGNAFTSLKKFILDLDRDLNLDVIKELCSDEIDRYIQEQIIFADKAISKHACMKIVDGDVILTYANSEVIQALLLHAQRKFETEKKSFRVIVVDSRPLLEGRKMLDVFTKAGIECSYIFLNSLSYVMKEVTKVFLGAAALMSDGSILSRVGTASVALMAQSNNIPVLICCESYKITSRVQLESITSNELGNPDDLLSTHCAIDRSRIETISTNVNHQNEPLQEWRSVKTLKLLNLLYDLTPSEYVSAIVTEYGILPPTSVAVLLREMNPQDNETTFA